MQECTGGRISYHQMMEDHDGLFHRGESLDFCSQDGQGSMAEEAATIQEAADAWAHWMRSEGYQIVRLPQMARTREWGPAYSVTAQDEDSRVYVVTLEL